MRIIVKTPNFIGDTIMMLPALMMLQHNYKDAKFTIVCKPSFKSIFRGYNVEKFIIDQTKDNNRLHNTYNLIRNTREESYSLGFLFHNSFSSALIFKLAKIDKIVGYKNAGREFMLDYSIKINRARHYINHYATLVNNYIETPYKKLYPIKLHTEPQSFFKKERKTVGLVLGTNKGDRGYPKKSSLELCKLLNKFDYQYILLGDSGDVSSNEIYARVLVNSINLTSKTDLRSFIDVINDLDLLVTIDTSAMHIASATHTDFIVLLGQGTSPFSVVKPKVNFGTYIFKGEDIIEDQELIKAIKPKVIADVIQKKLNLDR